MKKLGWRLEIESAEDTATVLRKIADSMDGKEVDLHAAWTFTSRVEMNEERVSGVDPAKPIIVTVEGGVVQNVSNIPAGIAIEVRDYDNGEEATEEERADHGMEQDSEGDWYSSEVYSGGADRLEVEREVEKSTD